MEKDPVKLRGSCHCGQLAIAFSTRRDPASIAPRACDCAFCRKHGAAYVSDPAGHLTISARHPEALHEYRQGSDTARFLTCAACGVLVAVTFEHEARLYGAANAGCLDGATRLGDPAPVSPRTLDREAKVSRWLELWVPDVVLTTFTG